MVFRAHSKIVSIAFLLAILNTSFAEKKDEVGDTNTAKPIQERVTKIESQRVKREFDTKKGKQQKEKRKSKRSKVKRVNEKKNSSGKKERKINTKIRIKKTNKKRNKKKNALARHGVQKKKEKGKDVKGHSKKKDTKKQHEGRPESQRDGKKKKARKNKRNKNTMKSESCNKCISKLIKYSTLNSKKVPTIIKQSKIITNTYNLLEKKSAKKDAYQRHFLALNTSLKNCKRAKNQTFANETKLLLQTLSNCSIQIERDCSNTLSSNTKADINTYNEVALGFLEKMRNCSLPTKTTDQTCGCLDEISRFNVTTLQDCNLNDENEEAKKYKSICKAAISKCKNAAVESAIAIHSCLSDETAPVLRVRPYPSLVKDISTWNSVKTISKTEQTATCCNHRTEEDETVKCGQHIDCESLCLSKGKDLCPTGKCTANKYDCDPESEEYKEKPGNKIDCAGCPITETPQCCYNQTCKKQKPQTCALKLTAFSGKRPLTTQLIFN